MNMENFELHLPTKIFFGQNQIEKLPLLLEQYGHNVLLVFGKNKKKCNGLYYKIRTLLREFNLHELLNVCQNPTNEFVDRGALICKKQGINAIVAVGGGSVIDCAKAISVVAKSNDAAWDTLNNLDEVDAELIIPLISIVTTAATGSEYNNESVITNLKYKEKLAFVSRHFYPKISIIDPQYTYSMSYDGAMAGVADTISHILERYFVAKTTLVNDSIMEGLLRTVIYYARLLNITPMDYSVRAELLWCSTLGDNDIIGVGNSKSAYPIHAIEHELSALYNIPHGLGIAVILPHWMQYAFNEFTSFRFTKFAQNVFNINTDNSIEDGKQGICEIRQLFKELGLPQKLSDFDIDSMCFDKLAEHVMATEDLQIAFLPLNKQDVINILMLCL